MPVFWQTLYCIYNCISFSISIPDQEYDSEFRSGLRNLILAAKEWPSVVSLLACPILVHVIQILWPHFYLRTSVSVLPGACLCYTALKGTVHPKMPLLLMFFHLHMGSKLVCYYYFWWKTKVEVQLRPYKFQVIHITCIFQVFWSFMVSYI